MNEVEVIRSQEDAWLLLERLVEEHEQDRDFSVEFSGWPKFHLGIRGERYSGTLPGPLLIQLAKIQTLSNSYYGWIVHEGDARNLRKYEKHELEMLFEVRQGSTMIKADLTAFFTKLSEALSKKKTSTKAAIVIIVLALSISGAVVVPQISEDLTNQNMQRINLQQRALDLAAEKSNSAADFSRTYKEIVSSVSDASSIQIGATELSAEQIRGISGQKRVGETVILEADFEIEGLRQYEDHFTLTTRSSDGYTIRARVTKSLLSKHPQLLRQLSDSLTSNASVSLTIKIKEYEDGYGIGTVTGVGT
jgi:hypothetical protein